MEIILLVEDKGSTRSVLYFVKLRPRDSYSYF